jgi:uncharacterized protein (DUF1501 family)
MKRRTFIQRAASAGIMLPAMWGLNPLRAFAHGAGSSPFRRLLAGENDRVLVLVRFFGGNDGLNTLVPFRDDRYYQLRGAGTEIDLSIPPNTLAPLDGHDLLAFHPSFAPIANLYNEGKVSIVQNVGYPNQNLSHFRSTDIWLSASDADVYDTSGWFARYLEEKYPEYPDVLPKDPFAIELDSHLGTTLVGRKADMGTTLNDLDYIPDAPDANSAPSTHGEEEEGYILEIERQSNVFMNALAAAESRQRTNLVEYPGDGNVLAANLARIARLIAAGVGTKMFIVNVDGFDLHNQQAPRHQWLLAYCADAIYAFQRDLEAFKLDHRVSTLTISEFGRRVVPNGTGTDHGAAAPLFAIGSEVIGGVIGHEPDLGDLDANGNLKMDFDFRQIYASVLGEWFGASDAEISAGALARSYDQLPIFRKLGDVASNRLGLGQSYPNPASTTATIPIAGTSLAVTLSLYTSDGRRLRSERVTPRNGGIVIDVSALAPASYIYEIDDNGARGVGKMVVVR